MGYEEDKELERRAHRAQANMPIITGLAAAGLALQQSRQHHELLAEERWQSQKLDEQNRLLREQAEMEEKQIGFTRDIQWLERSDAKGRFDYLLTKINQVECLTDVTLKQVEVATQPGDTLVNALSEAVSADAELLALSEKRTKVSQDLDSVSAKELRTRPAPILENRFMRSIGVGFLTIVGLGKWHRAVVKRKAEEREAIIARETELTSLLAATKKEVEDSRLKRRIAVERARPLYADWFEAYMTCGHGAFDALVTNGTLASALKEAIQKVEQRYPPMLRIDWSQIGEDFLRDKILPHIAFLSQNSLGHVRRKSRSSLGKQLRGMGKEAVVKKLKSAVLSEVTAAAPKIVDVNGNKLPGIGDKAYCTCDPDSEPMEVIASNDQNSFVAFGLQCERFGSDGPDRQRLEEIEKQFTSDGKLFRISHNTLIKVVGYYRYTGSIANLDRLNAIGGKENRAHVVQVEILEGPSIGKTGFVGAPFIQVAPR